FAVHSLKDVPTELGPEFEICAVLPRAETADVLISLPERMLLPAAPFDPSWLAGRTVATSSVRRARQLAWLCPSVKTEDIRGNVPTRIRKLVAQPEWDAILLARAGIERLGFYEAGKEAIDFEGAAI